MSDICPDCSADVSDRLFNCQACGGNLIRIRLRPDPPPRQPYDPDQGELSQFGIRSLMVFITVIAVVLALGRVAPGWTVFAIVFATPAAIRGLVVISRHQTRGISLSTADYVIHIFAACGFTIAIGFFLSIPLFGVGIGLTFLLWGNGEPGSIICAFISAVVLPLSTTVVFFVWMWRYREPIHNRIADVGFIVSWVTVAMSTVGIVGPLFTSVDHDRLFDYLSVHVPANCAVAIFAALCGLACSIIGLFWRPCLLACAGLGISASHIVAMLVMGVTGDIARNNGSEEWKTALPVIVYSVLFLSLAISPLIALATYWRIANTQTPPDQATT